MNAKEALQKTYDMWIWLYENEAEEKYAYFDAHQALERPLIADCYLCEYAISLMPKDYEYIIVGEDTKPSMLHCQKCLLKDHFNGPTGDYKCPCEESPLSSYKFWSEEDMENWLEGANQLANAVLDKIKEIENGA